MRHVGTMESALILLKHGANMKMAITNSFSTLLDKNLLIAHCWPPYVFCGEIMKFKFIFVNNLRAYLTNGLLVIVLCRIFCLPLCYSKI